MRSVVLGIIRFYQKYLSPDTGIPKKIGLFRKPTCVFYPSCSEYTIQAVQKYGSCKGIAMGIKRISRCHPWQKDRFDPLK